MAKLSRVPELLGRAPDLVKQAPKAALPFYHDKRWIALVRRLKAERGNWCQRCGRGGRIIGDHIVELKDGGALLDESNVELLCMKHHAEKTAREQAKRVGLA